MKLSSNIGSEGSPYYLAYEKRYQAAYAAGFAVDDFQEMEMSEQNPHSATIRVHKY